MSTIDDIRGLKVNTYNTYNITNGPRRKDECGGESFSIGRHHYVKESLGQWGPVRHKRGRYIQ